MQHWTDLMDGQGKRPRRHATRLGSGLFNWPEDSGRHLQSTNLLSSLVSRLRTTGSHLQEECVFRFLWGVLPFPELLSVDWDSLFTRFFPLRAS